MTHRFTLTIAAASVALLGVTGAGFATDSAAPLAPAEAAQGSYAEAPASILVEMRFSDLQRVGSLGDDASSFVVPVYFKRDQAAPSEEASQLLQAFADEAASYGAVRITIRPDMNEAADGLQAARAMAVFNQLNEFGVPARLMALDITPGPGASVARLTNAI